MYCLPIPFLMSSRCCKKNRPEENAQPAPEDTTGTVPGSSQSKTESNSHGHAAE